MVVVKELKKYKRSTGNGYNYRINISKSDNLDDKVKILNFNEYLDLTTEIKRLSNKLTDSTKQTNENSDLKEKVNNQKKIIDETKQKIDSYIKENNEYIHLLKSKNKQIIELKESIKQNDTIINDLTTQINNIKNEQIKENGIIERRIDNFIKENGELLREKKELKERINLMENNEKNLKESNTKLHESIEKITTQQHQITAKITKEYQNQLKESYDKFNEDIKKYITLNQLQNTALKQILELRFIDLIRNKHKKIAKEQIKELDKKPVYELTKKE